MAEVRHRLGSGAYNFAQKTCLRYVLRSQNKRGNGATRAASVSTELPVAESQHGGPCGAGDAEDGASRELYTKVTGLFETENIKDDSPPHNTSGKSIERSSCSFSRLQSLGAGRPCWGQRVFIRAYSGTRSEPLYKSKTGYYEILEVTPTATHAQIKTAYYKQSFVYHAGSEVATVRFSEISEAYTVLGNTALRKKYDRGLLSQADLVATARPSGKETATTASKQQPDRRRSVMDPEARGGGVFDFDTFFKSHYHEQLQREKEVRVRKEEMLRKKQETLGERKSGGLLEMGVGVMVAFAIALLISLKRG